METDFKCEYSGKTKGKKKRTKKKQCSLKVRGDVLLPKTKIITEKEVKQKWGILRKKEALL